MEQKSNLNPGGDLNLGPLGCQSRTSPSYSSSHFPLMSDSDKFFVEWETCLGAVRESDISLITKVVL